MHDLPVSSTYSNLEAYFSAFHPLMLHELWAKISQEYEEKAKNTMKWNVAVDPNFVTDEECNLIKCSVVFDDLNKAPRDSDLAVLRFTWKTKKNTLLAIIEKVNLIPNNRHKHTCNFIIRLRGNFRRVILQETTFTLERVFSLWMIFKQLKVHATLSFSPLCHIILSISKPGERTFEFIPKEHKFNVDGKLNPSQKNAVISVAVTMVEAPMHEPRIALLQGPPGTYIFCMI